MCARTASDASLAAISREAGLHKDWLSRHLPTIAPEVAADLARAAPHRRHRRWDAPWLPIIAAFGFADVPAYPTDRHHHQHRTVRAIATECGQPETSIRNHARAVDRVRESDEQQN